MPQLSLKGQEHSENKPSIQIDAIPQKIRGYGHIKEASISPAKAEEKALWGRWEKQGERALVGA
jgi:hypothetical protein